MISKIVTYSSLLKSCLSLPMLAGRHVFWFDLEWSLTHCETWIGSCCILRNLRQYRIEETLFLASLTGSFEVVEAVGNVGSRLISQSGERWWTHDERAGRVAELGDQLLLADAHADIVVRWSRFYVIERKPFFLVDG